MGLFRNTHSEMRFSNKFQNTQIFRDMIIFIYDYLIKDNSFFEDNNLVKSKY